MLDSVIKDNIRYAALILLALFCSRKYERTAHGGNYCLQWILYSTSFFKSNLVAVLLFLPSY